MGSNVFEFNYGFRPNGPAYGVEQARATQGRCGFVVDLDLEKFFDRVNHDRLLSRLRTRVPDDGC